MQRGAPSDLTLWWNGTRMRIQGFINPTFRKTFFEGLGYSLGLAPLVILVGWVF